MSEQPIWFDLIGILPPQTSAVALAHGFRPDWRYDAPHLARFFGLDVPRVPPPYLSEHCARHPVVTYRT